MIRRKLRTQAQRAGFAVFVVGLALLLFGIGQICHYTWSYTSNRILQKSIATWWGSVTHDAWDYDDFPVAAWGTYLTVVGLYLWLLYEPTFARAWRWIRSGEPR